MASVTLSSCQKDDIVPSNSGNINNYTIDTLLPEGNEIPKGGHKKENVQTPANTPSDSKVNETNTYTKPVDQL